MTPEKYLRKNYLKLQLIHKTDTTEIFLIEKISTQEKFILRKVERINLPYKALKNIVQKNLPKIFYAEENKSATFVVEEFLQGMNLLDYIKLHGEISEEKIIKFALELCDCLEVLHSKKILHRDIKPSNLFLTEDGEIKLIDFDAARIGKEFQQNDTEIIGTPGFAPPEQYGFRQTDARTDIYALGLTLKILLGFENYHGFLKKILDKCTEFDPARRFGSAKELKRAIILQKKYSRIKNLLLVSFSGIIISGVIFFDINLVESPQPEKIQVEEKISEKNLPVEEKVFEEVPEIYKKYQPQKIFIQERNSEPIQEQIVEKFFAEEERITNYNTKKDKIKQLIENYNKNPETYNVELPRISFENWKRNNYVSEGEEVQRKKFEEELKWLELQQRTKNFEKSLPEDVDKAMARHEFYKNELERLNLGD